MGKEALRLRVGGIRERSICRFFLCSVFAGFALLRAGGAGGVRGGNGGEFKRDRFVCRSASLLRVLLGLRCRGRVSVGVEGGQGKGMGD